MLRGYKGLSLFFWFLGFNFWSLPISYPATISHNYAKQKKIAIEPARPTLRLGEKLVYSVYWMGIYCGEGVLEVKELVKLNGREAYHVIATAKSNDFLSAFYKVEDIVHTYIDKERLYSLKFEKHQREGKYKADEITLFDQIKHKGYYESLLNKEKKEFDIPPNVQDLASVFYYFRTLDIKPNSKVVIDVNADEKNWKATMDILEAQELEIVRKGVHKVFCVVPKVGFKGVISKRGKAWVYFTVDENRIPVLIKIRVPFGFVVGVLERME
ncbi:MAG: DUF3108 domain-containing protein [Candidatus Omnitrophica bacterium]|nr:DUF3108 domain-containing protein [Candidatus Omnitrophota bacterium]